MAGGQMPLATAGMESEGSAQHIESPFTLAFHLTPSSQSYTLYQTSNRADLLPDHSNNNNAPRDASYTESSSADDFQNGGSEVVFDFDNLPKPSFLGGIVGGITEQALRGRVISEAARLYPTLYPHLRRPPTQEEASTVAYYTAEGVRKGSIGPFAGTAAGLFRAGATFYQGHWYLPLPFRAPRNYERGPGFDPTKVRFLGRELLQGQLALAFHRAVRSSLYALVGYSIGRMYYDFQVQSSLVRASQDPKLVAIKKATIESAQEIRKRIRSSESGQPGNVTQGQAGQTMSQSIDSATRQTQQQRGLGQRGGRQNPVQNDASPTYGDSMSDDSFASPETVGESRYSQASPQSEGRPGNERFAESQPQARGNVATRRELDQQNEPQQGYATQGSSDLDGFLSDSSSQQQTRSAQTSPQSGGSAWDRLRNGARSKTYDRSRERPAPQTADPSQDDDREQRKAQREFDAMLERERGGNEPKSRW